MSNCIYFSSNHVCPSHQVPTSEQNLNVSYLVRESFRTSQGPRSRTVSNISALPPEVRDLVAAALSGKTCVALEQIELSSALDYGGLAVLRGGWEWFALGKLFADVAHAPPF